MSFEEEHKHICMPTFSNSNSDIVDIVLEMVAAHVVLREGVSLEGRLKAWLTCIDLYLARSKLEGWVIAATNVNIVRLKKHSGQYYVLGARR